MSIPISSQSSCGTKLTIYFETEWCESSRVLGVYCVYMDYGHRS